jgi:CubicO group peptidase (beta-lactamase class C family)
MLRTACNAVAIVTLAANLTAAAQETTLPIEAQVDAVFAEWDSTSGPGCAVSVIDQGALTYARGYGMANLDHGVPIRPDTVFHVASVSKEFTAAAIALLALDGELTLDDPIQQHLPWVPDFGQRITIRNLVHHNSGIRDQWSLLQMAGWRYSRDRITDDDVIYLLEQQQGLNFAPGERYLYSNSGYTLLAQIVKAVSGQSLREFTTERIFGPLGMTRTHFRDDFDEIVRDQAYGYRWDEEQATFKLSVTNFDTVGATSLLTTVEDMAKWDRNFIDPVVGGQNFLDLIHQAGRLNNGEDQNYAFGLDIGTYRGLPTVGHGGADAGYRADFLRFPEQGYSFVALCNLAQTSPGRLTRAVADIYLADSLAPSTGTPPSEHTSVPLSAADASRLVGAYWFDELGLVFRVEAADDAIRLLLDGDAFDPIHTGDGMFYVPLIDVNMRFAPTTDAVEQMILIDTDDGHEIEAGAKLGTAATGTVLADYAGEYSSPELPVTYHLELHDGALTIRWLKVAAAPLTLVAADTLVGEAGSLRFERGADGMVTGFVLDSGRVRHFRFTRNR